MLRKGGGAEEASRSRVRCAWDIRRSERAENTMLR